MKVLERDDLLAKMLAQLQRVAAGQGMLLFVEGEAGIGKTTLLRVFADSQRERFPVRWGACDALQTPRPLGPLYDIATQSADELRAALDSDAERLRVYGAFLDLLAAQPSLVLLEDLHWADEATLDLLRFIGRRIGRTRSLVIASFRNDEVGPSHPLRLVLGDLATSGVERLVPQPLSLDAVRELVGDRGVDVADLHRRTGGNPFFVTEVLAAGAAGVPETVRDAVLTRAARLRPSARAVLDAAAVAGPRVEPWLLKDIAAAESSAVDECLATGVMCVIEGVFAFRHELARQAILQALTPTRLLSLHRLVLDALRAPGAAAVDLARLAHHAEGAGLDEAVLELAPAAARDAAAKGAHRQAAQQFARALRHVADPSRRAALLDDYSTECHLSGQLDEAIQARRSAVGLWRDAGDTERRAISVSRLAHLLVVAGRNAESDQRMREAIALVEPGAETPAAVATRKWAAYLRMLDRDVDEAIREGGIAMTIAERFGDEESVLQCLNTIGSSMIVAGRLEEGREHLERSLAMAQKMRSDTWTSGALGNLGTAFGEVYQFELAESYLRRGIEFCADRDIDYSRLYELSWLALVHMYRGPWNEASAAAHEVLGDRRSPAIARMMALIALGRVRARRGDPGVWEALDEARTLAGNTGTLQRVAPMLAARAEAAWLEGRDADAATEAAEGIELATRKRHAWFTSELLFWCGRGAASRDHGEASRDQGAALRDQGAALRDHGADSDGEGAAPVGQDAVPSQFADFCAGNPFLLEATGRWQEAAADWRSLGCPFETARALASGDEGAQREALEMFESLGARPMIERVRHQLRAAGVRGLPRGPRETTQSHPAGLTSKEVSVLTLLAQGLRSKEIAQRLNRSARTIDHHLAAIFAKLGVATRAEAVSAAYRLGVIAPRKGD